MQYVLMLALFSIGAGAIPVKAGILDKFAKDFTGPAAEAKQCEKGVAELCTALGYRYQAGREVDRDLEQAGRYFQLGCQGGDSTGCRELYALGFAHLHGKGVAKDPARAEQWLRMGCEGGPDNYSGSACNELAGLELARKPADPAIAMRLVERACAGGSRRGCHALGEWLLDGTRGQRDIPRATSALAKACRGENKIRQACARLGRIYNQGKLTARDLAKAEHYLAEACSFPGWLGSSCYELARLYETDLKGKKSAEEIAELHHIACHRADKMRVGDACVAAARMHTSGIGVEKDDNWVNELYNRGCRLNHAPSCRLSCEHNCRNGQPFACEALKQNKIPLGATNCYRP